MSIHECWTILYWEEKQFSTCTCGHCFLKSLLSLICWGSVLDIHICADISISQLLVLLVTHFKQIAFWLPYQGILTSSTSKINYVDSGLKLCKQKTGRTKLKDEEESFQILLQSFDKLFVLPNFYVHSLQAFSPTLDGILVLILRLLYQGCLRHKARRGRVENQIQLLETATALALPHPGTL